MSDLELDQRLHEALEAGAELSVPDGTPAALLSRVAVVPSVVTGLPRVEAPAWFAQAVATRISEDASRSSFGVHDPVLAQLSSVERLAVPASLASRMAARIAGDAQRAAEEGALATLASLPRQEVPATFARMMASRISTDAALSAEREARASTTLGVLYALGTLVGALALAALVWAWPYARTAGEAFASAVSTVSPALLFTYSAVAALALVTASGRVRPRLVTTLAAFAIGGAIVAPQLLPYFGSASVAAGATAGTVVRVGGDLAVSGHVRGDAINLGGSIRVEPGGRVDGMIVTLLGDVNVAPDNASVGHVSAVLGSVQAQGKAQASSQWLNLPRDGAASALQPVRDLFETRYWPVVYAALLASLAALLCTIPQWWEAVLARVPRDGTRAVGIGLSLVLVGTPVAALGALSVVAAPLALIVLLAGLLAYSLGASFTMVAATGALLHSLRLPDSPAARIALGLAVLLATLPLPPLAVTVWLLAGAWGAGLIVLALLDRRLTPAVQ